MSRKELTRVICEEIRSTGKPHVFADRTLSLL
jgi:hypothetical protein